MRGECVYMQVMVQMYLKGWDNRALADKAGLSYTPSGGSCGHVAPASGGGPPHPAGPELRHVPGRAVRPAGQSGMKKIDEKIVGETAL